MKICEHHWDMCRQAVKESGMESLVAASGEEAVDRFIEAQEGKAFEPLLELSSFYVEQAITRGGVDVLFVDEDFPENDGHLCPLCLFEKHGEDFNAAEHLKSVTEDMAAYCRKEGFLTVS